MIHMYEIKVKVDVVGKLFLERYYNTSLCA